MRIRKGCVSWELSKGDRQEMVGLLSFMNLGYGTDGLDVGVDEK